MDGDLSSFDINFVDDPIVPYPKAIKPFRARYLDGLAWKWI